jgi:5'-methylthioadenosine phosphorylase
LITGTLKPEIEGLEILETVVSEVQNPQGETRIRNLATLATYEFIRALTEAGVEIIMVNRHGKDHHAPPHLIDYSGIVDSLRGFGCTTVVGIATVGSLTPLVKPGSLGLPSDFVDRAYNRLDSVCDWGNVVHFPLVHFDEEMGKIIDENSTEKFSTGGLLQIQGPFFQSRLESRIVPADCKFVGMTAVSEGKACAEHFVRYTPIVVVTDYDSWKDDDAVDMNKVAEQAKVSADLALTAFISALTPLSELEPIKETELNVATKGIFMSDLISSED